MERETEEIQRPEPPPHFGRAMVKKWNDVFDQALKDLAGQYADDPGGLRQAAVREANRLQRVPAPRNYDEAMKLEEHQFILRKIGEDGRLRVLTSEGREHFFKVPAGAPAAAKSGKEKD